MHSHSMARLTPISWERLTRRHLDEAVPLKALAAQAGFSLRSAYKWLARFRDGGAAALADRRSVLLPEAKVVAGPSGGGT